MLQKKNRFHGHNSVSKVRGKKFRGEGFSVYAARTKRDDFRMAVVVSKKTAPSAVVRNRIRRRLYEAVRVQNTLQNQPVDVVFVVHEEAVAKQDSAILDMQIAKILQSVINI